MLIFFVFLAVLSIVADAAPQTSRERAQRTLEKMSLEEKVELLHGQETNAYIGFVKGNKRLRIKDLRMNDGPQGFRAPEHPSTSTQFPSLINLGATFDRNLSRTYGEALGKEFHDKGANVALGPGMNLARVPLNGRVFEYVSGGDGYLGSKLVSEIVQGIQSQKVIANAKHWVNNNQETDRSTVNEVVDERTRHELYYEPFQGAIDSGVGSFMCSYNKINSFWSCENPTTLGDLKKTLGFTGWVMSDWGATHSTSIASGLDQEMPGRQYFGPTLVSAVQAGNISEAIVDESVLRILTPMYEVGVMDDINIDGNLRNDVRSSEHLRFARQVGAESHVLLQNKQNTLPLSKAAPGGLKIALIGSMARSPIVGGGGSGQVFPAKVISPYEGIMNALNMTDQIEPMLVDCNSTTTRDIVYEQASCISFGPTTKDECRSKCATFNGCTHWSFDGVDKLGYCFYAPTAEGKKRMPGATTGVCTKTQPTPHWQCNADNTCLITTDGLDLPAAQALAAEADVTIIAIGTSSGEGHDRESLSFARAQHSCQLQPEASQDTLVEQIAAVAQRSVVAFTCPGACLTPWRSSVDAILHGFFPGEAYGDALADVLFGMVNPAGKLPLTMPNIENEVGFKDTEYPGINLIANYTEGLLIDYRWYTAKGVVPAFPFGHGLSYTSFVFEELAISGRSLACIVRNIGSVSGTEVVQLYLKFPESANTPPLQLKGFVKTELLAPGAQQRVVFELRNRDVSVWDVSLHKFRVVVGSFMAYIGSSSSDFKLSSSFDVTDN